MKKINVGILFGGKSAEHDVSLLSAKNVIDAIDKDKYELIFIGIDKEGRWHYYDSIDNPQRAFVLDLSDPSKLKGMVDVVFPVLHGVNGEDGTVQGLLRLCHIPFVGSDVLGSAIGMDKDVMKRLLFQAGIKVPKFLSLQRHEVKLFPFEKVTEQVRLPFYVKPANMGSSIGISIVRNEVDFASALQLAFHYDKKIMIEEAIVGREIEVGVIGNEFPKVSLPCEIIPKSAFQSYNSKYFDEKESLRIIPISLESDLLSKVQITAIEVYKTLCAEGFARVDLFLTKEGEVLVNEINTIPGMTNLSPFMKMWEATGVSSPDLIDRLIQLSLDRFEKEKTVNTHFEPVGLEYAK